MHARPSAGEPGAATPLQDDAIDWSAVVEATYVVYQRFRYDYPGPIADLHHRLMVVPREVHGDQRRVASRLDASPHAVMADTRDAFDNPVATFFARRIETSIEFAHRSIVVRSFAEHRVAPAVLEDGILHRQTILTAADAELRDAARRLRIEYPAPAALAAAINAFVYEHMRYVTGTTTVETTASAAFARGKGVCQDFAHVMLALARHAGLAARYVSGHLIGEGGTHAWVEVFVPDEAGALVVAYDPTHGCPVDMRYVVIAVGRDYSDVAPTSGVFTAPYSGTLTATKHMGATSVRYAS
jgi:transglutaminase-like putative cysteine protease